MYSIRLDGDVRRLMKRVGKLKDIDFKAANLTLAETLRSSTRERFKTQKSPEGKAWKTSIRAAEEGGSTLTDTARLKNSIKSTADSSGFAVGTNTIYGRTHQFGEESRTIRAKGNKRLRFKINGQWVTAKKVVISIPARPYLGISDEDMAEIKGTLKDLLGED